MENLLIILVLTLFTFNSFAQEGVNVKGNSVNTKEIAPVWPGCEKSKETSKACFNKELNQHIKEHFKYPKDSKGNLVRGRTVLSFSIDENGLVKDVKAEGEHNALNAEAIRITKLFPKMQPGIRGGKSVSINYKMPFNF